MYYRCDEQAGWIPDVADIEAKITPRTRAVVVINLAVQSYREGKTLYWDEKKWKASDKPVKG